MASNATRMPGDISAAEHRRQILSHQLGRWVPLFILAVMSVVILAPIMWTISTSLRSGVDSFTVPPKWLPTDLAVENYAKVFETVPFARQILNSAIITWGTVLGQLITAALAGYAFARLEFKGRDLLFWVVLATMMIPIQATVIPVFILIRNLGLYDTYWSLILPATPTAFGAFLLRQYYLTIPIELEESALIDGANQWQLFRQVYLPLVKPGLAVLAILSFNFHWNEFFRPLIFLQHENYPITIGIFQLQGYMMTGSISVVLAGVVVSLVPVIIIFLFGQRYLIEGIMRGAIKG
ncbi:MAG: carbohydrate ABC transporter permease [Chloroflexota bacterium]|nr:carbohydrate ABC transporter permease [Chloroflexota bacterium]